MSLVDNAIPISSHKPPAAQPLPRFFATSPALVNFYAIHARGAIFPAIAGCILFGWRAAAMLGLMLATAFFATLLWRCIGVRGGQLHRPHVLWLTLILWMMLPAHLLSFSTSATRFDTWPIPIAAALLLVILIYVAGGVGSARLSPVLVTYLLLVVCFDQMLQPTGVLQRNRLVIGDICDTGPPASIPTQSASASYMKDGYRAMPIIQGHDAILIDPIESRLLGFTTSQKQPGRSWYSLESLLRDDLFALEDLIIGARPAPIGASCAVAVIIGGLYLLYRGVIEYRVPIAIIASAFLAFLVLPIPVIIKEAGPQWRWMAFAENKVVDVGLAKAITFANYQMMAGPFMLIAFFLATAPTLRPMHLRARIPYGILIGILAAGSQLYVSFMYGPYLVLLMISLLSPYFDRWFRPKPLI